jgi:hypothetical protein
MQEYYGKRVQADLESGDPHRQLISDWFIKAGFTGKSLQKNDDFIANLLKGKIRHVPTASPVSRGTRFISRTASTSKRTW